MSAQRKKPGELPSQKATRHPGKKDRATARNDTIASLLQPGEQLVNVGRVSFGIYWKSMLMCFVAVLLMFSYVMFNLGVFFLLVAAIMFVMSYLTRQYLLLVLTNRRVIMRYGIIQLDTIQIRLNRIESIEVERTIPGQFLNYATLVVTGTGTRLAAVPFIENASQFRADLDELLYRLEQAQGIVADGGDMPG